MKYVSIVAIISMLVSCNALSEEKTVQLLKGDPSPYTGYLLDPARAQRVVWLQMDLDQSKKVTDLQKQDIDVLNQRINNLVKDNTDLQAQVGSNNYKLYAAFTLGIITTIGVSFAVAKITK